MRNPRTHTEPDGNTPCGVALGASPLLVPAGSPIRARIRKKRWTAVWGGATPRDLLRGRWRIGGHRRRDPERLVSNPVRPRHHGRRPQAMSCRLPSGGSKDLEDQTLNKESLPITSPPPIVPRLHQAKGLMLSLTNRMLPSVISTFTP